ncbi:hypothetical protein JCM11251_002852 [Rhodosporidiobolus azoricus]
MASKQELIRMNLNLKNLQRHDPLITTIVSSTSYTTVYENKGDGWVKTGVEGPMFLFKRSAAPAFGFFVLNRQGLEYVQEFLTIGSEVKVEGEFILFEGEGDIDRATGIWIYEEKERAEVCSQMEALRQQAANSGSAVSSSSAAASAPSLPIGQSISLDALFSSASPASSPAVAATAAPHPPQQPLQNPLDALFASASAANSPAGTTRTPVGPVSPSPASAAIPKTLEQLFAAASPTPQAQTLPQQQYQPGTVPPLQQSPAKPATGMALLDSIFASAKQAPSPVPQPARLPINPQSTSSPYQTPQPQSASLPFASPHPHSQSSSLCSPLPGNGSHTLPPLSSPLQQHQQQPTDARQALMNMIGLGGSGAISATEPAQANPLVNGDIPLSPHAAVPAPHTSTHPQPFSLNGSGSAPSSTAAGAKADESSVQEQVPEKASQAESKNHLIGGSGAEDKKVEGTKPGQSKPMFAPPVLSHDIFDKLPLPGKGAAAKGKEKAKESAMPSSISPSAPAPPQAAPADLAPPQASSPPALPSPSAVLSPPPPAPPAAATEPAKYTALAPVPAAQPLSRQSSQQSQPQQQQQPLLLSKAEILSTLDNGAKATKVGLPAANGVVDAAPLEKDEFVRRVVEMLQKPSFAMQLYGRYLERWEEQSEA